MYFKNSILPHLKRRTVILSLSVFSAILIAAVFLFISLGNWLIVTDSPPQDLDVICTFAGDRQRVTYSKELMAVYPSAHWLLSDYKNGYGRILLHNKYDMSRVTVVDTCSNTVSEVISIGHWIDANTNSADPCHIGLVSSPYHMRRIKIMAGRLLQQPHIHVYLLPVPLSYYKWDKKTFRYWWHNRYTTDITLLEMIKIGYFLFTGYF